MILKVERKNFKTFAIGAVFVLFLLELKFSKFCFVAWGAVFSREVKTAIEEILKRKFINGKKLFSKINLYRKIVNSYIHFHTYDKTIPQ